MDAKTSTTIILSLIFVTLNSQTFLSCKTLTKKLHPTRGVFNPSSSNNKTPAKQSKDPKEQIKKKDWNLIVYMAANNNLHCFSIRNLQQMIHIGSTEHINILVQLDGYRQQEISRYYVIKGNAQPVEQLEYSDSTISGTTKSLYEFVKWSVENYPAKHQALLLWNHGSGIKDPSIWGKKMILHRDELFSFNHGSCMLELNRGILDDEIDNFFARGIAFNDTFEQYITNQELSNTLEKIKKELLNDQKIDLLIMDACYMAMVEICSQIKQSAHIMVGSQEMEPGSGYNYIYVLEHFKTNTFSPQDFAQHIVQSYRKEYYHFNADFTQSAVSLSNFILIEDNIKLLAKKLVSMVKNPTYTLMPQLLKSIRFSSRYTTEFCDPDYIDFCHFLRSLQKRIDESKKLDQNEYGQFVAELQELNEIVNGTLNLLDANILSNESGINLPNANGLSIYFPKRAVHSSYYKTTFEKNTKWADFLHSFTRALYSKGTNYFAADKRLFFNPDF